MNNPKGIRDNPDELLKAIESDVVEWTTEIADHTWLMKQAFAEDVKNGDRVVRESARGKEELNRLIWTVVNAAARGFSDGINGRPRNIPEKLSDKDGYITGHGTGRRARNRMTGDQDQTPAPGHGRRRRSTQPAVNGKGNHTVNRPEGGRSAESNGTSRQPSSV